MSVIVPVKLEGVMVIFKLLLAIHAHVRLALLTGAVEAPLIQELVDEVLPRVLLARRDALLVVGRLLMLLGTASVAQLIVLSVRIGIVAGHRSQ